ncbi:hypothetical protein O6H91_08G002800 [Diphasiastrum complanatum]|uniref:Uncharacterized protein n=1 Tax=Diphasiastrum complanatum TaxID=34168 RepID=A0ACC2CV89_DIPCM|nr:hypothetical protein O6H91_08G002800 [Diphasiastrum complanatum]
MHFVVLYGIRICCSYISSEGDHLAKEAIAGSAIPIDRSNNTPGPLSSFGTTFSLRRSRSLQSFKQRKIYKRSANSVPSDVRAGYLAVYVGPERRRFIIKTHYLSHPLFKILLEKVEEEYGFDHIGGIQIPCEVTLFEHILWLLGKNDPDF